MRSDGRFVVRYFPGSIITYYPLLFSSPLENPMNKDQEQEYREECANEIWHGIPPKNKRKNLTVERICIKLSEDNIEKPSRVFYEHQLNFLLAKEQSRATYITAVFSFIGIFVGWALAQFNPFNVSTKDQMTMVTNNIQCQQKEYNSYDPIKYIRHPDKLLVEIIYTTKH